jgi:hypothetical protein
MPKRKRPPEQRDFNAEVDGKVLHATYVVQDGCIRVSYQGRQSTWTQLGGTPAEFLARMLLREIL